MPTTTLRAGINDSATVADTISARSDALLGFCLSVAEVARMTSATPLAGPPAGAYGTGHSIQRSIGT